MPSMSLPRAITGLPDPQVAMKAVGMPATPSSTVKPFLRRMSTTYRCVSVSWNPSSPKLKIESTICWVCSFIFSTSAAASSLSRVVRASSDGMASGGACGDDSCANGRDTALAANTTAPKTLRFTSHPSGLAKLGFTVGYTVQVMHCVAHGDERRSTRHHITPGAIVARAGAAVGEADRPVSDEVRRDVRAVRTLSLAERSPAD